MEILKYINEYVTKDSIDEIIDDYFAGSVPLKHNMYILFEFPKKMSNIPLLEENMFYLKKLNENDIKDYYKDFSSTRLRYAEDSIIYYGDINICNYCHNKLKYDFYKCSCHLNMCKLCYVELNIEKAIENGAKNWHKRKEKILFCRNNHKQSYIKDIRSLGTNCFQCHYCVSKYNKMTLYSTEIYCMGEYSYCINCYNELLNKMKNNYDIEKCSYSEEKFYESFKNEKICYIDNNMYDGLNNFGSLLDWIPIYKDDDNNLILYNANVDAKLYKKFILMAMDDHGRVGFGPIFSSIKEIKEEFEEMIQEKKNDKYEKNEYESDEINLIIECMENNGIPTYYG